MISTGAFQRWLAELRPTGIEIIEGLRNALPGKIDDPDVRPGERIRAGGYGEDRGVYSQVLFAPEGVEPRTVHLGFDIFALAGADVFTPLNARVHSSKINEAEGDYGPTIILEHAPAPGLVFHTLYGHLSRDSLKGLKPGAAFMAGERIGELGTRRENGGWSPHLHFQVILDIGDWRGDYPGVCKRSERDHWLAICPDPRPLLGLA
ncbi:MAG TPA: peptidoglycan DD-metalloendopeptidase family protein [Hyphomonadaceae bacterium]|nr:peptidoglycan DD-metalloendopeptidase family protein [Hyphomonadaceae bacterium]